MPQGWNCLETTRSIRRRNSLKVAVHPQNHWINEVAKYHSLSPAGERAGVRAGGFQTPHPNPSGEEFYQVHPAPRFTTGAAYPHTIPSQGRIGKSTAGGDSWALFPPAGELLLRAQNWSILVFPSIPSPSRERVRVRVRRLIYFTLPVINPLPDPFAKQSQIRARVDQSFKIEPMPKTC